MKAHAIELNIKIQRGVFTLLRMCFLELFPFCLLALNKCIYLRKTMLVDACLSIYIVLVENRVSNDSRVKQTAPSVSFTYIDEKSPSLVTEGDFDYIIFKRLSGT